MSIAYVPLISIVSRAQHPVSFSPLNKRRRFQNVQCAKYRQELAVDDVCDYQSSIFQK